MAALLAGTGLVLGQAPEYYYVQGGPIPSRAVLPAATVSSPAAAPEGGSTVTATSCSYDCGSGDCGRTWGLGGCGGFLGGALCGSGRCGSCGDCGTGIGCGDFCNNTVELCGGCAPYTCYGKFEFLIWNIAKSPVPASSGVPLLSTLTFQDVTVTNPTPPPATLDIPVPPVAVSATVTADLPGGNSRLGGEHLGGRITAGMWFDAESHCGFEVSAFAIERRASNIASAIGPISVSPEDGQIFIPNPAGPGDFPVAGADFEAVETLNFFLTSGASQVASSIANEMWGIEANGRCGRYYVGCFSVGSLAGVRYINFREDLFSEVSATLTFTQGVDVIEQEEVTTPLGAVEIIQTHTSAPAVPTVDTLTMASITTVQTRNQWYGYQVGGDFEWACGPCFLNGFAKVGLGGMHQAADTLIQFLPATESGTLTQAAINGHHTRNRISGILEGNINIGYALTPAIRTYLGYNYLYIMRVARANGLIVNGSNQLGVDVAGTTVTFNNNVTPILRFDDRDMWVQGINFGVELRY